MYYLGIDIGSMSCDSVLIDSNEKIISTTVVPTGAKNKEAIERSKNEVLTKAGISDSDIAAIISTGYGRERVDTKLASVTEITCHARGIQSQIPGTKVLIDIGGQDSKTVLFNGENKAADFAMNDKCAAGTGRFLEAMARALHVDLEDMINLDIDAIGDLTISSMCTVFAESEVVSLIADGKSINEIVHGLNRSIASRTVGLVKRLVSDTAGIKISMSGGVARNSGVIRALNTAMGCEILVPEEPDTIGALGAALIAKERFNDGQ